MPSAQMNILSAVTQVASGVGDLAKDALGVKPPEDTGEAFAKR